MGGREQGRSQPNLTARRVPTVCQTLSTQPRLSPCGALSVRGHQTFLGGPLQGRARGAFPGSTSLRLVDQCHRILVESGGPVVTHFIWEDGDPNVTGIRTEPGGAGGISAACRPWWLVPRGQVPHRTAFSGQDPNAGVWGSCLPQPAGNSPWEVRRDGPGARGSMTGVTVCSSMARHPSVRLSSTPSGAGSRGPLLPFASLCPSRTL